MVVATLKEALLETELPLCQPENLGSIVIALQQLSLIETERYLITLEHFLMFTINLLICISPIKQRQAQFKCVNYL
jgi:hypothetical protein